MMCVVLLSKMAWSYPEAETRPWWVGGNMEVVTTNSHLPEGIATVQKSQLLMWHIMALLSFLDLEIRQSKFGEWLRMIFCRLLVQSILVTGFGHWLPQRLVVLP